MTTIANYRSVRLPSHFYNLSAYTNEGRKRWEDEFADAAPSIIQPSTDLNLGYMRRKSERNKAYSMWIAAKYHFDPVTGGRAPLISGKMMKFQAIRVLSFKHSEASYRDWWENYQDALFRVFVQPETIYDKVTGEHKQWYVLSPEDAYLVNRYEFEKAGKSLPPRDYKGEERWISSRKELRTARLIPVECCHHLRHETTAGKLPEEL
jgi:hypothetical protein